MLRNFILCFASVVCGTFLFSCGLEEVITVAEPTVTRNNPLYSSADFLTWYCSFVTEETGQLSSFIGTEIYYKIYNNYSNLNSQRASILSVNTSSNGSSAATKMIDSYTYQPLGTYPAQSQALFVPATSTNQEVVLRLKNYSGSSESDSIENREQFLACVKIGGTSYKSYIPYRNGNTKSFDFFDDDDDDASDKRDVEPAEGDADYYYSATASEENHYYVQLFAVGVAWDSVNCSRSYSLVLDLGSIPIIKDN